MTESVQKEEKPFDVVVGKLLSEMQRAYEGKSTVLGRGDLSAFKRMDPSLPAPGFWKLMAAIKTEGAPGNDERWAVVVKAMALMVPNASSNLSLGAALAKSGFSSSSDLRINRILKAEGAAFDDYLLSAFRYLSNKAVGVNWWRCANFIHWPTDKNRLQVAKDFYLSK